MILLDEQQVAADLTALSQQPALLVHLERTDAWMLLSTLQLALRHPGFHGHVRERMKRLALQLQDKIATTPALAALAEAGWRPEHDE